MGNDVTRIPHQQSSVFSATFAIFAVKGSYRRMHVFMRLIVACVLLFVCASLLACGPKPLSKDELMKVGESNTSAKRYHLKGKVVSIDKRAHMANIDGEEIPGFMGAMVMPYVVKPASELDKLSSGDAITGDVVVQDDNSWIENITVTAHGTAPPPK